MLRFSLAGIPVTVNPTFWLIALLLGFDARIPADQLVVHLASWVVIVFTSVLAHELGHAVVARRYGAEVSITLFFLGGYTTWQTSRPLGHLRRVGVAAAGSVVGFALGGLGYLLLQSEAVSFPNPELRRAVSIFVAVNLFWGLLNWLPIRPLDGGHIFSGLAQAAFGDKAGQTVVNVLFPVVTLAAGLWAWSEGLIFAALLAGFVMVDEVRRWGGQRSQRRPARRPDEPPTEPFTLFGEDEPRSRHGGDDDVR